MKNVEVKEFVKNFREIANDFYAIRILEGNREVGCFYPEILHRDGGGGKFYTGDLLKEIKDNGHKLEEKGVISEESTKLCEKCHKVEVFATYIEDDMEKGEEYEHKLCVKCGVGMRIKK